MRFNKFVLALPLMMAFSGAAYAAGPQVLMDDVGNFANPLGNPESGGSTDSSSDAPSSSGGTDSSGHQHQNNGHGNNLDGIDSSNPGKGSGGPNGAIDPSAGVDDEIR